MDNTLWSLSEHNRKTEVLGESHFPPKLGFYDTTLRDGEQTIGLSFDRHEKLEIARALDSLGVDRIEAGMPVVSKEDKEAVDLILRAGLKSEVWGFCRSVKGDIDACIDVGVKRIICEIATSPQKMKAYNYAPQWVLDNAVECLQYAKGKGLYTAFFAVDSTRADIGFLEKIYRKAVDEGQADEVVLVDTVGAATPETMFYLTRKLRTWVNVPIMVHCHNNFGMATSCTMFAVKAGAQYAHGTINGLGEIAGNGDFAQLSIAAGMYGIPHNIDFKKLPGVSSLLQRISKIRMSPLAPVVGDYIFKRETGVTAAQLISYPPAVEPYSADIFGLEREVLLSKKSGKRSVEYKLEKLGRKATPEQVNEIMNKVKDLGVEKKGILTDAEFQSIVAEVLRG